MQYPKLRSEDMIANKHHVRTVRKRISGSTRNHFHDFFEIELILGGEGVHSMNGTVYKIQRGSVFLMTPADFHDLRTDTHLDVLTIMFDDGVVRDALIERIMAKSVCLDIDSADVERIDFLADMLMAEEERADAYTIGCIKGLLESILALVLRYDGGAERSGAYDIPDPFDRALRFLYSHFRDNPPLAEAARIVGYSPAYFSKLFSARMGVGYADFLNGLKVNLAKALLTSTDETSAAIAFFCGFGSLSNFYRVFSSVVGVSPQVYRASDK